MLVNRAASLGHHVVVGDFAAIGADVLVGTGAVVGPSVHIGAGSVLAPGAVACRDLPARSFAAGNAARVHAAPRKAAAVPTGW